VLPGSDPKTGVWVEGMSLRRDIDQREMWAFVVAASRTAKVRPPLSLPFSNTWLLPGALLDSAERDALRRAVSVNALVRDSRGADSAEYDPAHDADFGLGAYAFAFWRLCRQPLSVVDHEQVRSRDTDGSAGRGGARGPGTVDRVRIVQLRAPHACGSEAEGPTERERRYHHRWPVRMHKVRQYYPSADKHKIIWRGPYIKGPDGAPLLIGPKAQVVKE
jgi:hypothetical protein